MARQQVGLHIRHLVQQECVRFAGHARHLVAAGAENTQDRLGQRGEPAGVEAPPSDRRRFHGEQRVRVSCSLFTGA